jgi:hypothetical protein
MSTEESTVLSEEQTQSIISEALKCNGLKLGENVVALRKIATELSEDNAAILTQVVEAMMVGVVEKKDLEQLLERTASRYENEHWDDTQEDDDFTTTKRKPEDDVEEHELSSKRNKIDV